MTERSPGRLFGVGVGPSDPELMTVKARRIIETVEVIAYPGSGHGQSVARAVAEPYLRAGQAELQLLYPVTTGESSHPDGYEADLGEFYDRSAAQIAEHLDRGRDVAVLCVGDPFFYGSYMYLHDRLAGRYETEVIPGVTSVSAASAVAGEPLARRDEVLTVLPGTLPTDQLEAHLRSAGASAVIKLGRGFDRVRGALERAGIADRTTYVERATRDGQRIAPIGEVDGKVPYMSLALVPEREPRRAEPRERGEVTVVGLGPGGPEWLTPEAADALAAADELVGYGPYLERVPARPGQRRHPSDNRHEAERAQGALALAAAGSRVAVVSSGDPGIYAMASALLEAMDGADADGAGIEVRIVPGISAMQVAAARAGAPLGHDFCVLSLSDNLKPWEVIEERLAAAARADLAIAIYNPSSRARPHQLERARELLSEMRSPGTPVVVARDLGGPAEAVEVTTLAGLDCEGVDMRTLLIVGSSTTQVSSRGSSAPRVYTPRRYDGRAGDRPEPTADPGREPEIGAAR